MKPFAQKNDLTLRFADPKDAACLRDIYAPYVEMPVSFEYDVPSIEEFTHRIEERYLFYPYLVLCSQGQPVGYAYASRYKIRAAYQWDVELSIYVHESMRGRGAGRVLYTALLELLRAQGVYNAFAIIGMPNVGSKELHKKFGFRQVGTQYNAGFKCGEWHDVLIFQKELVHEFTDPAPVIPIVNLDEGRIQAILDQALELSRQVSSAPNHV